MPVSPISTNSKSTAARFAFPLSLKAPTPRARLLVVLFLALLVRLAFWVAAGPGAPLSGDELQYQQLATNLASGRGFVENTNPFFPSEQLLAWQAPLYPFTLALLYRLFGFSPNVARLFQVLLGVGSVYLTYRLAFALFPPRGSPASKGSVSSGLAPDSPETVALAAALSVAFYPGLITHTHLLLSETLFTFLLQLAILLLAVPFTSDSPWTRAALAGFVLALATLTRGVTLYFAPLAALWLLLVQLTFLSLRSRLSAASLFLVAFLLCLVPWAVRNQTVFDQFVLLETKGGVNFWLGNSPHTPPDFIRNVWKVGVREPMLAELPPGELARDRAGYSLGFSFIGSQPFTFLARILAKFADFWGFERNLPDSAMATRAGSAQGWNSPAKLAGDAASALASAALLLTASMGLAAAPPAGPKWLILALLLYFTALHAVVFGDARFHIPLLPFLAPYAAWFALHLSAVRKLTRPGLRMQGALASLFCLALLAAWFHELAAAFWILFGGPT